jgi:Thermolysin metallopeptidase, alpha-helical domain
MGQFMRDDVQRGGETLENHTVAVAINHLLAVPERIVVFLAVIWYVTLTQRLTADAGFAKCATETVSVARDLFPEDPAIATKVAQAWTDVGVLEVAPASALIATAAGAYVIAPRLREVAIAPPPAAKTKKRAAPPAAAKAPRGTHKKKAKSARARGR